MTGWDARSVSGPCKLLYVGTTFSINVAKQITVKIKHVPYLGQFCLAMIFCTHFYKDSAKTNKF